MRLPRPSALIWYGLLLVLPALLLGIVVWNQIRSDHQRALAELPERVERATQILAQTIKAGVEAVLEEERQRPFTEYSFWIAADRIKAGAPPHEIVPSPFANGPWPPPRLGWYSTQIKSLSPTILASPAAPPGMAPSDSAQAFEQLLRAYLLLAPELRTRLGTYRQTAYYLRDFALLLLQEETVDSETLRRQMLELDLDRLLITTPRVQVGDPLLHLIDRRREAGGRLHVFAWRLVTPEVDERSEELLRSLKKRTLAGQWVTPLLQAFEVDTHWLFEELPQAAALESLQADEVLFLASESIPGERFTEVRELNLIDVLPFGFGARIPLPEARLRIGVDSTPLRAAFRTQIWRFSALVALLAGALAVGLSLLITDVRRKLERAEKMDNFVSAVTHELRTPLATIALHTEMLLDGYAKTPERSIEYLRRVESETRRLSNLVERVLEKSALAKRQPGELGRRAEPSDLSRAVASLQNTLEQPQRADLAFELAPQLPLVRLSSEALTSILINLVENARKYAPVAPGGEAILVRTASAPGGAWLEVLDRGPGIPEEERSKVFEAFYRIGNERTRRARGTGLGLHLVEQQARALGGRVELLGRPGGGAWFRVFFPAV